MGMPIRFAIRHLNLAETGKAMLSRSRDATRQDQTTNAYGMDGFQLYFATGWEMIHKMVTVSAGYTLHRKGSNADDKCSPLILDSAVFSCVSIGGCTCCEGHTHSSQLNWPSSGLRGR